MARNICARKEVPSRVVGYLVLALALGCTDSVSPCEGAACEGVPSHQICTTDLQCEDGIFCNGTATCEPSHPDADEDGCVPGKQVRCDDGIDCTVDTCEETSRRCESEGPDCGPDPGGSASGGSASGGAQSSGGSASGGAQSSGGSASGGAESSGGSASGGAPACDIRKVLANNCSAQTCHGSATKAPAISDLDLVTDGVEGRIYNKPASYKGVDVSEAGDLDACPTTAQLLVDPAGLGTSLMWLKVMEAYSCGDVMPTGVTFDAGEQACFRRWLEGIIASPPR